MQYFQLVNYCFFKKRKSQEGTIDAVDSVRDQPIDWNSAALPKNWERRADPITHKMYYVDHETRKTQWRHPYYDSKSKTSPRKNDNMNSLSIALNESNDNTNEYENDHNKDSRYDYTN